MALMSIFQKLFRQKPTADSPATKETAQIYDDFSVVSGNNQERYNPDVLVNRKGADIYRRMLRDSQVKSAYDLLIDILISRSYRFEKNPDEPLHDEIEDFFRHNLNNMKSTWTQAMRSILLAKAQGFSVSEKVYKVGMFEGKEKWMIDAIKPKPYESFTFHSDKFGNLLYFVQQQSDGEKKLNPNKFIIYVNRPEFDPLYGESDLRAVYRPYWEKDNILKFWNIHLERVAGGFTIAQAEPNAPILSPAEKADFENVLRNITQATAMRVPAGYNVSIVHGANTDAFEKAVQHRDKQIAKGLMIPNLIGFSEQGATGSFAQAKTQLETFLFVINQQGELLADALNEQLFSELALWNYDTDNFPRFAFEKFTDEQKREIATVWAEAVKSGTVVNTFEDEQRTRELLSYDQREETKEDEEPSEPIEEPSPDPEDPEPITEEPEPEDPEPEDLKEKDFQEIAEEETEDPQIMRRVNLSDFELSFADNEMNFGEALAVNVDEMFEDVLEVFTATAKRLDDKADVQPDKELETLDKAVTPKTKSLMNKTIQKYLKLSYDDGRNIAQDIMGEAAEEAPTKQLSERIRTASTIAKRTAVKIKLDDQTRPWYTYSWSVKNFVDGLALDTAERYFMAKAFWVTGDLTEEMVSKARIIILNGIRDELTLEEMIMELKDVLSPLIGKLDPVTGEPDKEERARLNTIVNTNLSDSFTQAQLAVYNDPDLGDFVQALKYSSILDKRTSDFCRSTNGKTYPKDSPIWGSITPPNHFNCRSILIPVTEFDDYKISKKPTDAPAKGFGGGVQFLNSEKKDD